jgi:hypothetical protein
MNKWIVILLMVTSLFGAAFHLANAPIKGVAMAHPEYPEDILRLGSGVWYHTFGACPDNANNCIPYSRDGSDPNLDINYNGYVFLFYEPDIDEPWGHYINPFEAVNLYMALDAKYKYAEWIVGNVTFHGQWEAWLEMFSDICHYTVGCKQPDYYGVNVLLSCLPGYEDKECINYVDDWLNIAYNDVETPIWITVFADVQGNILFDDIMTDYFNSHNWIKGWFYLTNRLSGDEPWLTPSFGDIALFDWDTGEPTAIGEWYIEDIIPNRVFMPVVIHD